MAFSNGYVFGFAGAICLVCSLAVSSVSLSLRDKQNLNKERDKQANILEALGLPDDGTDLQGEAVTKMFEERVQITFLEPSGEPADGTELDQDGDGDLDIEDFEIAVDKAEDAGTTPELLAVYERKDGGKTTALALPMSGKGLWGPLSGYVALDAGKKEVVGTTFFAPKETPGLGAEIQEPPFEQQWVGKSIRGDGGDVKTIRVVKGEAKNLCPDDLEHCVDGVSGATITSRGVDEMVAQSLEWYDPFLSSKQGGR